MTQKQLSTRLGCDHISLVNWELNRNQPSLKFIPTIIDFLGFDPFPEPQDIFERLQEIQRFKGIRIDEIAQLAGVSPWSIGAWKRGVRQPSKKSLLKIEKFLELNSNSPL